MLLCNTKESDVNYIQNCINDMSIDYINIFQLKLLVKRL